MHGAISPSMPRLPPYALNTAPFRYLLWIATLAVSPQSASWIWTSRQTPVEALEQPPYPNYGKISSIPNLRSILKLAGKGESKVAAVFGFSPAFCHLAVVHLRKGAPDVPVWLFATVQPTPETTALCDRVLVRSNSLALMADALRSLWPVWVALSVAPWTGGHGRWALKLAPFLIPPFRVLLLNTHGDFFSGTPAAILRHVGHRLHDAADSVWNQLRTWWHAAGDVRRDAVHWVGGVLVNLRLLVQFVLGSRWLGHPHCRMFHKLHGTDVLAVPEISTTGEGIAHFLQKGTHWDAEKLERLARSCHARWILWRDESASDDTAVDLSPPFDDPHAFAVSRQSDFRAWKPMMIPTAPFRTLQPGETSRVLAPVSNTILVDRQRLLALGIPRTALSGTAWMLLFWKAAAAGWHSFSAGQKQPLTEQPDFPMQEIGFLFRLLADPALRRLGPREPALSRGAIATKAGSRDGDAARLKVLLVSPFLPYPLSHGGAVRIFNLCRELASRVDFILVAIREKHDSIDYEKLHEIFEEVYTVDIDERPSRDERLPAQVRGHQSGALRALIADLARTHRPDLLQLEYTHMAAFRDAAPNIPAVLVEHDLHLHALSPVGGGETGRRGPGRISTLACVRAVLAPRLRRRVDRIGGGSPGRPPRYRPRGGANLYCSQWSGRTTLHACNRTHWHPEIFYVGSFRHLPNILGFQVLLREVMPRVWTRFPDTRLRVVAGPQHTTFWKGPLPNDPRIEIHGFVEDLRPLYAKAALVAVPLEVSAGTNIKVLEAMACGKAVVTTPTGCAGLGLENGIDALIRSGWDEFAAAACDLLADPALRARIAVAARSTTERRFSWAAIADAALNSYSALARAGMSV